MKVLILQSKHHAIMIYKIRVVLNAKEDAFRDIAIKPTDSLEELHHAITNAFAFNGNEMASFYRSDHEWSQGEEFPLMDMNVAGGAKIQMNQIKIKDVLKSKSDKLIYIYDFFNMWSFFVELIEDNFKIVDISTPSLIFSLGTIPSHAPDIQFESEDLSINDTDDEEEDFNDEFDMDTYLY